ncbi:hypothetical protein [Gelidibacter sp.]|nr:hypothetical protein [Gelidibacter sp.]HUH29746.1 hypothetical protein [Gelidibacter sp.]
MRKAIGLLISNLRTFLRDKLHQYDVTLPYIITVVVALLWWLEGLTYL